MAAVFRNQRSNINSENSRFKLIIDVQQRNRGIAAILTAAMGGWVVTQVGRCIIILQREQRCTAQCTYNIICTRRNARQRDGGRVHGPPLYGGEYVGSGVVGSGECFISARSLRRWPGKGTKGGAWAGMPRQRRRVAEDQILNSDYSAGNTREQT